MINPGFWLNSSRPFCSVYLRFSTCNIIWKKKKMGDKIILSHGGEAGWNELLDRVHVVFCTICSNMLAITIVD